MNKHLHRIVFNAKRGQMMAVLETASSQGKSSSGETHSTGGRAVLPTPRTIGVFGALTLCGLLSAHAQIIADRTAPGNQQPTILSTANGLPQVNIQAPSAGGVSRNVYSQFDVQSNGVILNNSRTDTTTQLGGFVQGNPWLATGSARVILNEVNSSNPSQLKGFVEVAGSRAEVIIANPAGISVNGGGFINASAVTLTTGTPVMNAGNLESYRVHGGSVTIEGKGLDTSTADYTNILARAVQVNASLWAKDLKVITGTNEISAGNVTSPAVTGTVAATGPTPTFALDVAALGGMYAGKIFLIGTEAGLGVSNGGTIGATAGDVVLSNTGWLSNSGTIQATGNVKATTTATTNTATGQITAGAALELTSTGDTNNRGLIDGGTTTKITAATLNNTATGRIYGDSIAIQATTLNNAPDTVGGTAPTIASRVGDVNLGVGTLFNNEGALIYSSGALAIGGSLDTAGKATGRATSITNNSATIESVGAMAIQTATLKNTYDTLSYKVVVDKVVSGSGSCGADCYTVYDETHYKAVEIPGVNGPGKIISGTNLTINASTSALNDRSQILAGSVLDIAGATIVNKGIDVTLNIEQRGTSHQRYTWTTCYPCTEHADYHVNPFANDIADNQTVRLGTSLVSTSPNTGKTVPTASIFQTHAGPGEMYLIATDPRFTNYKSWLGSDYMSSRIVLDPTVTQKRLGDGFYEQKLIRDQIASLSGRRFLGNYTSDEQQYQALMDAGITSATAFNLRPGIALTAQQVAQLTSDIVWLEETTVTLADGSKQKVITPRVYLMPREGDLAANGALLGGAVLGGAEVKLTSSGDITNSGSILGRDLVTLDAKNIHNLAGGIQADTVKLTASQDINNLGGTVAAQSKLEATAGRNLTVESTTRSTANDSGVVKTTNQAITRLAGLYVTKADGVLLASATNDVNLIGAQVGSAGTASITAGRDLNLKTVTTRSSFDATVNADNYNRQSQSAEVGSTIQGTGNTSLSAGNNLTARAANVQSGGELTAKAGNNITIEAGVATQTDASGRTSSSSGGLATSTTTNRQSTSQSQAVGSNFGGNTVKITSGQDTTIKGSTVLADKDLRIAAAGNVTIEAAKNTNTRSSFSGKTESGLTSSGVSVSLGTTEQSTDQKSTGTTAAASTVGSVGGNVSISSGKTYTQTGSDVVAPAGDIAITAKTVNITEARETSNSETKTEFKQSGITLSVGGGAAQAAQTVQSMDQAAKNTSSDRMKALAVASAAMAAKQALTTSLSASASIGSSESTSTSSTQTDTARGSNVTAGGNVTIQATGANQNSNLTIQGSNVQATGTTSLSADNDVRLLASANTASQSSSQSSSSSSIGIDTNANITLAANSGSGDGKGSDISYTNTQVGGKAVNITSGADTTLKGAVVKAEQVTATVGGNLNIESLQDKSNYTEQSKNIGGSVTIGPAPGASISLGKTNIDSNYESVTEQSGIQAGDGGFKVAVTGNTDLKGSVIASTQKAVTDNKNSFTTGGTLTTSDIQNKADYKAEAAQVSVGVGSSAGGSAGVGNKEGSASSMTTSGISGVAGNTAVRTGDAPTGIAKIFDKDQVKADVNAQVAITSEFGKQAPRAVANYAEAQATNLRKAGNEDEAVKWDEGGAYRVALHTVLGGLTGGASGALGAGAAAGAAPLLDQLQASVQDGLIAAGVSADIAKAAGQVIGGATAAGIGAALSGVAGAASGFNIDANNRQLHPSEVQKARDLAAASKGKYTQKQIEDALRSSANNETGESIVAGMVVDSKDRNAIFDKGAVWTTGEDGKLVQVLPPQPDADLAKFIKDNTGTTYSWYTPSTSSATPSNAPRDKLTNLPLDDKGRYSQTVVLDGKPYEPKYLPCATAQCIAGGQNLDTSDPATQAYIKALDAQVFKDINTGSTMATLLTPTGIPGAILTYTGLVTSVGSAFTDSDPLHQTVKNASQFGATEFFTKVLGHSASAAARFVSMIDLSGGWDAFTNRVKLDVLEIKPTTETGGK
jgi:filamentous hemagglutinin